ncbi:hypothetical protein F5X68DRAFT_12342 [Plectosphaerella plurivora]|uniref:WSC domain-containing protein n=1 Tax=Plectosphaerella plurivora TaxID=936078 RepID=A0A9P8VCL4_9PEZI|nr:hypothetical protein F5X68DRAFT_12342 [Plectosphaerella plurivora]
MKFTSSFLLALAAATESVAAQAAASPSETPKQPPIEPARMGGQASQGCFKSKVADWDFYKIDGLSTGACHYLGPNDKGVCVAKADKKYTVSALSPDGCYCGWEYPPKADIIKDSDCNFGCPAYPGEACGGFTDDGTTYYSVFNIGVKINVPYKAADSSSSSSSSVADTNTPAATSGSSQPASSSTSPSDEDKSDGGPSVGGIVGGVVAGVAIVGILGAVAFFIWRRRRNQAIEDEHRRNATVNSFISGAKPTSSSGVSMTDSRMDPGMAHQRRLSDGSIADNQDYSRKILRVTNA